MSEQMIFSVSELNRYVSSLLSADYHLQDITVQGEISGFKRHTSGHLYFSLKDPNAVVDCVMFKTHAQTLDFYPEDGQQVSIQGTATLYEKNGRFQLYVTRMESNGAGALFQKFMELKNQLEQEGLFAKEHKKAIPFLPKTVGIVTSGTGAALQDILQIIGRRFPKMNITLCPVKVQGEGAAKEIAEGIRRMNAESDADVLIVGRGGGSMEDLWAFNEPKVAYAIYESNIPVISAVGHETDFTIADFVADLRAPTPSAAAELAVPEYDSVSLSMRDYKERLSGVLERDLEKRRDKLALLLHSPSFLKVQLKIGDARQTLDHSLEEIQRVSQERLQKERALLEQKKVAMEALSPNNVLKRGFALIHDQKGCVVKSVKNIEVSQSLDIRISDGTFNARVETIKD